MAEGVPAPGQLPGPAGLPGGLTGVLGAVTLLRAFSARELGSFAAPGREARSAASNSSVARGKVLEPETASLLPEARPEAQPWDTE